VILRPNHSQTVAIGFEAQTDEKPSPPVLRPNWQKPSEWFWGQTTHKLSPSVLRPKPMRNRPSCFETKPLINCRPWFWGSTKKLTLLVSTCQVQTTHGATRPLDHPATEYLTYATIPDPLHQSPNPAMILIAARHAAPATCTPWDKQTRFSKWNKDKRKTKWNCPRFEFKPRQVNSSQSNQETDHLVSQSSLDESIDNKSTKFEVWIQDLMKHEKPRKAQEDHLGEGKQQKPTKGTKSGKAKQNDKEELRKAQKKQEKLNLNTKAQKTTLPLKSAPLR
jgi:hypothetical protein